MINDLLEGTVTSGLNVTDALDAGPLNDLTGSPLLNALWYDNPVPVNLALDPPARDRARNLSQYSEEFARSGIARVTLLALSCLVLGGPNPSRGADPAPQAQDGPAYGRWKSCAELVHPERAYSVSDLQAMLERPRDIQQFLQNLKVAWERDLLPQPSFYDEATLLKLFNGTKVTWNRPDPFVKNLHTEFVAGSVASDAFPGIVAKFESNCSVVEYKTADGATLSKVAANGFLNVAIGSVPEMTLKAVKSVFGHEAGQSIDRGVDPHGNTYATTEKGSVVYTNVQKDGAEDSAAFYFRLDTPARPAGAIVDDDVVTRISMRDMQSHTVGSDKWRP
jgi:hypothetical protein